MRKIFLDIATAGLIFFLFILIGVLGWQFSSSYRSVMANDYQIKAREYASEKNSMALWELEKSYFMGLKYRDYRISKAIIMSQLGDTRAGDELRGLVDSGWTNSEVFYHYAKYWMQKGDNKQALVWFARVGSDAESIVRVDTWQTMARLAGTEGDWEGSKDFISMASEDEKADKKLLNKMSLGIALVYEEEKKAMMLARESGSESEIERLFTKRNDAYWLAVADWLNDNGLTGWGRMVLTDIESDVNDKKNLALVMARSYLIDGERDKAEQWLKKAGEVDSADEKVSSFK